MEAKGGRRGWAADDPAGCSHLEGGEGAGAAGAVAAEYYDRTLEQAEEIGLSAPGGGGSGGTDLPATDEHQVAAPPLPPILPRLRSIIPPLCAVQMP